MLYHQWLGTKKRIDFCGGVQVLDCHCAAAPPSHVRCGYHGVVYGTATAVLLSNY